MANPIRVGIIGANPERGWAKDAHVPAIKAVPELVLAAVATTRSESARSAAAAFGAAKSFGNAMDLVHDPDVDLVIVAVKVPEHRSLVMAAIEARKPVFCEWPLGRNLAETEEMAEAASGLPSFIGLQGRASPWLTFVRRLIAEGAIGDVLSTTFLAGDDLSNGKIAANRLYMLDPANGANALTILGGHYLDSLAYVLGDVSTLSSQLAISRPDIVVNETAEVVCSGVPDQIAVAATLADGAIASIHIRAGRPPTDLLQWEIQGSEGLIRITSATGMVHWRPLRIQIAPYGGALNDLAPPPSAFDPTLAVQDGPAHNVAYMYRQIARDLIDGTSFAPSFDDALNRHRTIDAINRSSTVETSTVTLDGERMLPSSDGGKWPVGGSMRAKQTAHSAKS